MVENGRARKWFIFSSFQGRKYLKICLTGVFIIFLIVMLISRRNKVITQKIVITADDTSEDESIQNSTHVPIKRIAVVVMICNRKSVTRCLDSIVRAKNYKHEYFSYYISQSCENEIVSNLAKTYKNFTFLKFSLHVTFKNIFDMSNRKISHHYKHMFGKIFDDIGHEKVIVIEDDLEVSYDFFSYFLKFETLLDTDKSLFCISAWNDHGIAKYAYNPYNFRRTDLFPGSGFMINKTFWDEVKEGFPEVYWDEYFRNPVIRKSRNCIYPEISRVLNFGEDGVSLSIYYNKFIKSVIKNNRPISYKKFDNLALAKKLYDYYFYEGYIFSLEIGIDSLDNIRNYYKDVKVKYKTGEEFRTICKTLSITSTTRYGIPSASYYSIIQLNLGQFFLYIVPDSTFNGKYLDEFN